jgi:hypothetical protein
MQQLKNHHHAGLARTDGKHLDGVSLILWNGSKPVKWDVTINGLRTGKSYIEMAARDSKLWLNLQL